TLTAGCVQDSQYSSGYGPGYATTYGSAPVYTTSSAYSPGYASPAYVTGYSSPAYTTGYTSRPVVYATPAYTATAQRSPNWNSAKRDTDRDGTPNRYDHDANGDGVADRYQGRR